MEWHVGIVRHPLGLVGWHVGIAACYFGFVEWHVGMSFVIVVQSLLQEIQILLYVLVVGATAV